MPKPKHKALSGAVTINLDRDATALTIDKGSIALAAEQIEVTNDDACAAAGSLMTVCAQRIRAIEEYFEGDKSMAHRLHQSICAKIASLKKPYEEAREVLEAKIKPYRLAQKRHATEVEAALTEEAEITKKDMLSQARRLRKVGKIREAIALEEQAEQIVVHIMPDMAPEIPGLHEREPWKAQVVSLLDLVVAVAEGRVPLMHKITVRGEEREVSILTANEQVLNYLARGLQSDFKIPGCKAEKDLDFAVRGA